MEREDFTQKHRGIKWQKELELGTPGGRSMLFATFADKYARQVVLEGNSQEHLATVVRVLGRCERLPGVHRLSDVTTERVDNFHNELLRQGNAEGTRALYLRILMHSLRWAQRRGYLQRLPLAPAVTQPSEMTGRPLSESEYHAMLDESGTTIPRSLDWAGLIEFLWLSGFRIGEAVRVSWDKAAPISIRMGPKPKIQFRKGSQKSGKAQLWTCPPDLAEWLHTIQATRRHAYLLHLRRKPDERYRTTVNRAGWKLSELGEDLEIVTDDDSGRTATAHDLRRSFCSRWAALLPNAFELIKLSRHSSIKTAEKYYVRLNQADFDERLYAVAQSVPTSVPISPGSERNTLRFSAKAGA